MDKKYLLYNNVLWEPYKTFTYTGEPEAFTLNSGTYLLVANGARGGNAVWNAFRSWGGTTYGVLDLDHTQSFYAFVGGNGEDTPAGGNPRAKVDGMVVEKVVYHIAPDTTMVPVVVELPISV